MDTKKTRKTSKIAILRSLNRNLLDGIETKLLTKEEHALMYKMYIDITERYINNIETN